MTIEENIATVNKTLRELEKLFGRDLNSVVLLAVSKGQSIEKIEEAIRAGQRAFGENYLQEALSKIEILSHHALEWHFIGPIQSNKTKKIAESFSWVHSVSEANIATRLNNQRPAALPPLNICLQVNVSQEKSKSGAHFDEICALAEHCATLSRLKLRGLMTIPSPKTHFIEQRAEFYKLRLAYELLIEKGFKLDTLSMGMSDDLPAAVAEGATIVRIGKKIFGERGAIIP